MSIQDANAPDRVSGHLASGILVDGDIVLTPNPSEILLDPGRRFQVLVFPAEVDEHAKIDIIDVWKWTAYSVRGHQPVALSGRMLHHSTYAAQIGEVDNRELAEVLEKNGGDLWDAFVRLRAVPPEIREIDPGLLERVTEIERRQREPKRTAHEFGSYQEITGGWCIFFCFCHPEGGK